MEAIALGGLGISGSVKAIVLGGRVTCLVAEGGGDAAFAVIGRDTGVVEDEDGRTAGPEALALRAGEVGSSLWL